MKKKIAYLIAWTILTFAVGAWAGDAINGNMRGKNSDGNWVDLTVSSSGYVQVVAS